MSSALIQPEIAVEADRATPRRRARPAVKGKFIFVGDEKLYLKGVTYGPFRPEVDRCEYHTREQVEADFAQMAGAGVNTVRVYTVPPRWLLDVAEENGLYVMVGLPWEQHVTFLDDAKRMADIESRVREAARTCAGHSALLAFAVGNEIPAPIVRWHGHARIEKFIERLTRVVKEEDPGALVTYVNYPSTEYLYLPFVDFVSFNVYLETREKLEGYLARLQNIAGDKPLVMAEVGLDSLRNGEARQGETLAWQIECAFAGACAGVFIFSWTDEWFRGGHEITDWKFGLTTIERETKIALEAVKRGYERAPFAAERDWPMVSVVVCTYNGSRTIGETLEGLARLEYGNYEVIVVDDGSRDGTAEVVKDFLRSRTGHPWKLITTTNMGLSAARNTGLAEARGEIIAYIDDDAWPDPHWLMYLADAFMTSTHAAVGGPNIAPGGQGLVAHCVAHSPGGPTHVLVTDRLAEHLPGCNMAFRTAALREIGGVDPQFAIAGDDVDVCWRIQERGWTMGFAAGAMVWHHRRKRVWRYWKQQFHYGKAEGQLERKWPMRYTASGRITWSGRLYDRGAVLHLARSRRRIYHGTWGSALFQSVYGGATSVWASLGLMPGWYLMIGALLAVGAVGAWWEPLRWALAGAGAALLIAVYQCGLAAVRAPLEEARGVRRVWAKMLTAWLHLTQPIARLIGHLRHGMTPWRRRGVEGFSWPRRRTVSLWSETWKSIEERLSALEGRLMEQGAVVVRGGDYDRWDLQVRGGVLGAARVRMTIEEHGSGKQLMRYVIYPAMSIGRIVFMLLLAVAALAAGVDRIWWACGVLGALAAVCGAIAVWDCGAATAGVEKALLGGGEKRV